MPLACITSSSRSAIARWKTQVTPTNAPIGTAMVNQSGITVTDIRKNSEIGAPRLITTSRMRIVWKSHMTPTRVIDTAIVVRIICAKR